MEEFEKRDRKNSSISDITPTGDKYICMNPEGHCSSNVINIYFSLDYSVDHKWLLNIREDNSILDLCKEITNILHHEFDEFKELSSLKISNLYHKETKEVIPLVGDIRDHLVAEQVIICEIRSYDIWINIQIYYMFKQNKQDSQKKYAQATIKMKVENNLSCKIFKGICQKLAFVIWNKYT